MTIHLTRTAPANPPATAPHDGTQASAAELTRIFAACHGTQLLVIEHLRRHLRRPPAREFLLWHPIDDKPAVDRFMKAIVTDAGFDGTLDMRDFASLKPRTQGPLRWWFESTRRLRRDAATLRAWMTANGIDEAAAELWTDEPIHFNVILPRGLLRRARHVKIPHCFNHDDCSTPGWMKILQAGWCASSWPRRFLFLPWQRWVSGVDTRMERVIYERAYTFASASPWCANSIDVSKLISPDAFAETYDGLPNAMRADVEAIVAPIRAGSRPLVVLLLFGLAESSRTAYQRAIARILCEHAAELRGCSLVVKWHPSAAGEQEPLLVDWLRANVAAQIHEIRHPLNLEFILPQLRPDFVLAGLCGALPIVRDLHIGRPAMLAELMPKDPTTDWPGGPRSLAQFLQGIEVW